MRQLILLCVISSAAFAQNPASSPQTYTLKATPKTVAWGYYDAAAAPVLHIHSGDTVVFETLITNSPERLEKAGVMVEEARLTHLAYAPEIAQAMLRRQQAEASGLSPHR